MAEEDILDEPITWDQFTKSFFERFFPETAKRDMEQQFVNIKKRDRSIDEYTAEFLGLSRFAPYMVTEERNKANHFLEGLPWDIQENLTSNQLDTYNQVLTVARRVEHVMEWRNNSRSQSKLGK